MKRMKRAFTLIELLIVVAIISIFASVLIATVTAPAYEQNRSIVEREQEAGAAIFFSRVAADAHEARDIAHSRRGFVFSAAAGEGKSDVAYLLDDQKRVWRLVLTPEESARLLEGPPVEAAGVQAPVVVRNVEMLEVGPVEEFPGVWRITLATATQSNRQPLAQVRQMDVGIGHFWAGGGR